MKPLNEVIEEEVTKYVEDYAQAITDVGGFGLAKHVKDHLTQAMKKAALAVVKKIEKAYGGCHYCYGKGYGTQTAAWEGRGYYKKLPTMKFCTCERGEQLKSLLTPPLPDQLTDKE